MSQIATTIEQSKRLISAGLDPESADMMWEQHYDHEEPYLTVKPHTTLGRTLTCHAIPAWSLSKLIDIRGDFNYGPMTKGSEAVIDCIVESMIYLANNSPHRIREYLKK